MYKMTLLGMSDNDIVFVDTYGLYIYPVNSLLKEAVFSLLQNPVLMLWVLTIEVRLVRVTSETPCHSMKRENNLNITGQAPRNPLHNKIHKLLNGKR